VSAVTQIRIYTFITLILQQNYSQLHEDHRSVKSVFGRRLTSVNCCVMIVIETNTTEGSTVNTKYERKHARELTFARDGYRCLLCNKGPLTGSALDAHHLLERRLWEDDGYHVDNLVTVCEHCHIKCEKGVWTPARLRELAQIKKVIVPDHMYDDVDYDKWGNVILSRDDKTITRGPLMDDDLRVYLTDAGWTIVERMKYPRSYHLPWSNPNRDDQSLGDINHFMGKNIVVTEKLDGECITMYNDYMHARSIDGKSHPSQGWMRNFHAGMGHNIPADYRVCGEYMYARHSIKYDNLETYFYVFSVWDGLTNLSWSDTLLWCQLLDLTPVPVIYQGPCTQDVIDKLKKIQLGDDREGYVIRLEDSFHYKDFKYSLAKYVRPNHLQSRERWDGSFEKNGLAS
jgi:5-methylcytosine-specific restriction endonuclease McrA